MVAPGRRERRMIGIKAHNAAAYFVAGIVCFAAPSLAWGSSLAKISGAIAGQVTDSAGVPQMGAKVFLFNRQERLYDKVLTNDRGQFVFLSLFPDVYSVRVTLASFVPALKKDILVQPGMRSMLNVSLSGLFSSIELLYPSAVNSGLMSDDWKWVLRSASATRPVLRFVQPDPLAAPAPAESAATFSDVRGILQLSGGEGSMAPGAANEADLGTAFALATSVFGNNSLELSGNMAYGAQTGAPSAAFRTGYSLGPDGNGPQVSVTMRQLYLPDRQGIGASMVSEAGLPILRSFTAAFDDRKELSDKVSLQYGGSLDSVSFLDRLNYFSRYARLTYSAGDGGEWVLAYTSGNPHPDLAGPAEEDSGLERGLNTLGLFPRLSMWQGQVKVQRGNEYEVAYNRKAGSRVYHISTYREEVTNAALMMVAPAGFYGWGDILPDQLTGNSVFNAGDYRTWGYTAAATQNFGSDVAATAMYGSMGGLTVDDREVVSNSPDELRSMIRVGRKQAATARLTAAVPWTGTRLMASYQWTPDQRWATAGNLYGTDSFRPLPGLNILLRQPIRCFSALRMEATAELRNLLAQGYLPLNTASGQSILLVQTPRSFRGGLRFIF
jgi:Carboxypeptidase regulatory-like domain